MSTTVTASKVVVTPDASLYFRGAGARVLIAVPLALVMMLFGYRSHALSMPERWVFAAGMLALVALIVFCLVAVPRIEVTSSELRVRNALGITKRHRLQDLTLGVVTKRYDVSRQHAARQMLLIASEQHRVLMMNGYFWTIQAMEHVLAAARPSRVDMVDEPLTPAMFDRRYPRLLPFADRRPVAAACVIMLAIMAVIAAGVALAMLLHG